jgi:hypothetical protein
MANRYPSGSLVRVANYKGTIANPTGGFRNVSGALTDPTVITLAYSLDGGTPTVVVYPASPIIQDAVGLYHADLVALTVGTEPLTEWTYEFKGTGAIIATQQNTFEVYAVLV